MTVLGIKIGKSLNCTAVKDAGVVYHLDISHTLGNCMKHVYGKDAEFEKLTSKLGKIRLHII